MRKSYKMKIKMENAEQMLRDNLNGKVYLTNEGKKLLQKAIEEKRV